MSFNPFKRRRAAAEETPATPEPQASTEEPTMSTPAPETPAAPVTPAVVIAAAGNPVSAAAVAAAVTGATIAELRAAFPADADFVFKAHDAGWTVAQAKAAHDMVAAVRQENAVLKANSAALAAAATGGVAPVGGAPRTEAPGAQPGGVTEYQAAVEKCAADNKIPMAEAVTRINRERPDLRKQAFCRPGRV